METSETSTTGRPTRVGSCADRAIIAQRVDGVVELRDEPAEGDGNTYLIEPELIVMAGLKALVADYTATAARIDDIPMKRTWY
jgi:hypothetical protein